MKFNRPVTAAIGLLTVVPYAWLGAYSAYLLPRLMSAGEPGGIAAADYFPLFYAVYYASIGVAVLMVLLLVVYLTHLYRGGAVAVAERHSWALMLIVLGFFLMPVYWYRYMWRPSSAGAA